VPTRVSPSLLATYLTAAARQALAGRGLSDRSQWAITNAQAQLKANHAVISGREDFLSPAPSVGVRKLRSDDEPDLAEIVLDGSWDGSAPRDVSVRAEQATVELDAVLADLQALASEEDPGATEAAARRLIETFGAPVA
jgi:hypothetical protein